MDKGAFFPRGNVANYFCALVTKNVVECFSRRKLVVSFWGFCPQTPTGAPPLDPAGNFRSPNSVICPPLQKVPRAPMTTPNLARTPANHRCYIRIFQSSHILLRFKTKVIQRRIRSKTGAGLRTIHPL